ncbi:MAG: hypothetical protein IH602_13540 [Bryobacteraceae bacterium]|jgi:hypothetical protein|nr:hypothetical protein [Bryobacteraceae bacterium]
MQTLYAGSRQLILLELEADLVRQGATECGFDCQITESDRQTTLELSANDRESPLLLFDAADQSNTGWFSRCQYYVDARTGAVLQTPFLLANKFDARGRLLTSQLRLQIRRELSPDFRLPGRQAVSERVLYSVLFNFLNALSTHGVGLCGEGIIKPTMRR